MSPYLNDLARKWLVKTTAVSVSDLTRILGDIIASDEITHVTPLANVADILADGLLAPKLAAGSASQSGIGSTGSNVAVVQLFDYCQLTLDEAVKQLEDLLANRCFERGAAMIVLCSRLRGQADFVAHPDVRSACKLQDPEWLYYLYTETWWNQPSLPARWVVRTVPLHLEWARLRVAVRTLRRVFLQAVWFVRRVLCNGRRMSHGTLSCTGRDGSAQAFGIEIGGPSDRMDVDAEPDGQLLRYWQIEVFPMNTDGERVHGEALSAEVTETRRGVVTVTNISSTHGIRERGIPDALYPSIAWRNRLGIGDVTLVSASLVADTPAGDFLTPSGENIWKRLVKRGQAVKAGNRYVFKSR